MKNSTDNWKIVTPLVEEQKQSNYSCGVITQKYNNYTTIARICLLYQNDRCELAPSTNGTAETCICNTDNCNSSNMVSSSIAALLSTIFLLIISNCSLVKVF